MTIFSEFKLFSLYKPLKLINLLFMINDLNPSSDKAKYSGK